MGKRECLAVLGIISLFSIGFAGTDPGIPDTVRVGTATATAYGQQVVLNVYGYNDENLAGVSVPLKFNGVALIPDSVSYVGGRLASASITTGTVTIDTIGQTVVFGAVFFGTPLAPGSGMFVRIFFTVKNGVAPDTIDIDTLFNPPSILDFAEPNANEFTPQFVPGKIFVNVPPLPVPHSPVITVPGPQQVFAGFNISFSVTATDVDTADVLTITKTGPGNFTFVPKKSPASGFFSWTTTSADTLGSPHLATFIVNDGTGLADTGEVSITVLPFTTPPSAKDGDVNGDGLVSPVDIQYLVNYIFHDGPPPNPLAAGDVNGDCFITVADIIYLSNYILKGGPSPMPFCLPGDLNHDGFVNLPDIIFYVNYLLLSGPAPASRKSADVNADCKLDLADVVYLVNFLFRGGPLPQPGCAVPAAAQAAAVKPAAEVGMTGQLMSDNTLQISVALNLGQEASAVMFKIEYDPSKLRGLEPTLTSRSQNMSLHYNDKGFRQTIGLLDLTGNNPLPSGQGTVLVLRFQVLDKTDLEKAFRVTYSEVVAKDASEFEVRLVKGIQTISESAK